MESLLTRNSHQLDTLEAPNVEPLDFIEANTCHSSIDEIRDKHIIPVFLKDNEPVISQVEFAEVLEEAARKVFNTGIQKSTVKVSHPIKGRVFNARHKKANELLEHEKTIYYERMAIMMEIPGFSTEVGGNRLDLTIGGIKAYNLDNLNSTKGANEHFKVFVGYKNMVCTNLCISTNGSKLDLKVKSSEELYRSISDLFNSYAEDAHIYEMNDFTTYDLSEQQFAQVLGKARLYQYLPKEEKLLVPELLINDTQISRVAEYYYNDEFFHRGNHGSIDLWKFYNLLTGAVKSSYLDKFLEREVNSYSFTKEIRNALENDQSDFWYLG